MRGYAILAPEFWTGTTGKLLLAAGDDAVVTAVYLISNEHRNATGLYRLPIAYIANDLRRGFEGALKGLRRVCDTGFALYDEASETVYVPNMARFQFGESLAAGDNRCKFIASEFAAVSKRPFAMDFWNTYASAYHLPERLKPQNPLSPSEGASKGLQRPFEASSYSGSSTDSGTTTRKSPPTPNPEVASPPSPDPSGLFGPDGPDGETRPEPQKSKAEPNGAKILADLWAELCPHLDQPRRPLAPGIARSLVASWKRDPDADLWRERFAFVAESDTYSGRKPGFSWKADISWATGPKNSAKLDAKANRNHEAPVENFSDYNRRSAEQAKRIRLPWETEDVAPWDTEALPDESQRDPAPPVRLISSQPASDEAAVAAKVNGIVRGFLNGHR